MTLLLSNLFYLFISTHMTLLPNHKEKQLVIHGAFKNAGSKPVRGRLHGSGAVISKEALDT